MLWLEWVIQSGRMIDFQVRGSVACRPFPFALPLSGMSNIRFAPSSYLQMLELLVHRGQLTGVLVWYWHFS